MEVELEWTAAKDPAKVSCAVQHSVDSERRPVTLIDDHVGQDVMEVHGE